MRKKLAMWATVTAVVGGSAIAAHALATTGAEAGRDTAAVAAYPPSIPAPPSPFEQVSVPAFDGGTMTIEIDESIRRSADVPTFREVARLEAVSAVIGDGTTPGDVCMLVRTGIGQQTFGCSSVDEVARKGVYGASRPLGQGFAGAFAAPQGATTVKINGTAFPVGPSGVVTFAMARDVDSVTLEAVGAHGPVSYTLR